MFHEGKDEHAASQAAQGDGESGTGNPFPGFSSPWTEKGQFSPSDFHLFQLIVK